MGMILDGYLCHRMVLYIMYINYVTSCNMVGIDISVCVKHNKVWCIFISDA